MPKDPLEDVLDALATQSVAVHEPSVEDLDRIYSEAVSEGLVTEQGIKASFARFLGRSVGTDPHTGEPNLAPTASISVGVQVRSYRTQRSLSVAQLARQFKASLEQLNLIENSSEPFRPDQLSEVARVLARQIGVPVARVHTLLQAVRATLQLKSSSGPELMAARKVPPK